MKNEALKLALEAFKSILANDGGEGSERFSALRLYDARKLGFEAIAACEQALEQPEPEPVAYWYQSRLGNGYFTDTKANPDPDWKETPLYTTPPKREPLTEEQIWDAYMEIPVEFDCNLVDLVDFARAIEAAHGIKGEA